jgi:hypothetical protein
MTSHLTDYGSAKYKKVEDKMTKNIQKTYKVNKDKEKNIKDYLETQSYYLETQSSVHSGVFKLKNGGEVKIQPYELGIEIRCNCGLEIINKLEDIINKK